MTSTPKIRLTAFIAGLALFAGGIVTVSLAFKDFSIGLEPFDLSWHNLLAYRQFHGPTWADDGLSIIFDASHKADIEGTRIWKDSLLVLSTEENYLVDWVPDKAPDRQEFLYDMTHDLFQATGMIAFATLRHGVDSPPRDTSPEMASARMDGSQYRRLTDSVGLDMSPAWSPDGTRIAFVSDRVAYESVEDELRPGSSFNVYVMNADGRDVRNLAPSVIAESTRPMWSPDGRWLAFMSGQDLCIVSTNGSGLHNLGKSFPSALESPDWFPPLPAWSPDSRRIAYFVEAPAAGTRPLSEALVTANPDGSDMREVVRLPQES